MQSKLYKTDQGAGVQFSASNQRVLICITRPPFAMSHTVTAVEALDMGTKLIEVAQAAQVVPS